MDGTNDPYQATRPLVVMMIYSDPFTLVFSYFFSDAGGRKQTQRKSFHHLWTAASVQGYHFKLTQRPSQTSANTQISNQVEETRRHIKNSMSSAASSVSSGATMHPNDHWISSCSVAPIETRKTVQASNNFDGTRRYLRHQNVKSLKDDVEH